MTVFKRRFLRATSCLVALTMLAFTTSCTTLLPIEVRPRISVQGDAVSTGIELSYEPDTGYYVDPADGGKYLLCKRQSWFGRNWKWIVAGAVGLGLGMALANGGGGGGGGSSEEAAPAETTTPSGGGDKSAPAPSGGGTTPPPSGGTGDDELPF